MKSYLNGMRYEGTFAQGVPDGFGVLSGAVGSFTYTGQFTDGDMCYGTIMESDIPQIKDMFGGELTQTAADDCFYLENEQAGITLRCRYAGDEPAAVTELCAAPLMNGAMLIRNAGDVPAWGANSVVKDDIALIPAWAAKKYALDDTQTVCYTVKYNNAQVRYWVVDGKLALKTAIPIRGGEQAVQPESMLSEEEIEALFKEVGLDIEDFRSLGF